MQQLNNLAAAAAASRNTAPNPHPTQQLSITPNPMHQMMKGDRSMFMGSDDSVMMRQIQETHAPDGRDINVRPLLHIVEDILNRASVGVTGTVPTTTPQGQALLESMDEKSHHEAVITMVDAISFAIDRVSCEIACKCMGGGDGHATTVSIMKLLSSYPWEAKLVLTLAAFALQYGEFWLLAQIYTSNQLAKSMAILKQLPVIIEHSGPLQPRFDVLNNLIKAILDLTRCIVDFKELPSMYIQHDAPSLSSAIATIPTAVYWCIRGIIACGTQISGLTSMGHEYISSTAEAWELSTFTHKINNIHEHLNKQLAICHQHIEEKMYYEAFESLKNLFNMIHIDNMKVLRAFFGHKEELPLVDGTTKRRVSLDVLRRRNVLLLISGLDISHDELSILEQIYNESRIHATRMESLYEVVWVPITDRAIGSSDPVLKRFESLQSTMPWYTVHHPTMMDRSVIRFIREVWHFRNKPILVVLDPQGRVLSPNAIHMMWIWGSNAFPFTSIKEEALWKEETWRLELLVDGIDPTILNWIRDDKYIFLYGGDDIEWIRRFTTEARAVAQASRIPLELVYVGKSTKREQVRKVITTITLDKLSYCWQDLTMMWFFWTRLESMLFSKIQLGRADDQDHMMQEIKKLLSYDRNGGWAILSKGSSIVINGHGSPVLTTLSEYDTTWKVHVPEKGFNQAIKDHYDAHHEKMHACCRFEFPSTAGRIPDNMKCPECRQLMEKYISFLCCHDENAVNALY